jgi:uncharacterized protein
MPEQFLHGVEVVEIDGGTRPIKTVKSSVIGLIGTSVKGPMNEPTLIIGSRKEGVEIFGAKDGIHTIPDALDAVFDQAGAMVVVIRVERAVDANGDYDEAQTKSNVMGNGDVFSGVHGFSSAQSTVHVTPRILVAPGFSHNVEVVSELEGIANKIKAVILADGPNTTDADAITYRGNFGSDRIFIVDPSVKVFDTTTSSYVAQPASPRVAGLISKMDNEKGFWWSPSNQIITGIAGTWRPVDYAHGNPNSKANLLNENEVTTIIHQDGYRLWGNRTTSSDPKFAFLSVRRTADMIQESLLRAHLWAVDRNITRFYAEDVKEGVNAYLRNLKAKGAILGGECYLDPELNTPENIASGKIYFDFDFTPPYPAEHVTFRSHLVNDYIEEIFPVQQSEAV